MSSLDHNQRRIQTILKTIVFDSMQPLWTVTEAEIYRLNVKEAAELALSYIVDPPKREKITISYTGPTPPVMTAGFQLHLMKQFPGVDIEVVHLHRNMDQSSPEFGRAISDLVGVIYGNDSTGDRIQQVHDQTPTGDIAGPKGLMDL